ncbi:MAG: hypothetical protein Q8T04_15480, partial [Bacteroidota bacterium]|nr:hypothetical protein [Bacteroidota bacterium]
YFTAYAVAVLIINSPRSPQAAFPLSFEREGKSIADATGRVKIFEQLEILHLFILETYFISTIL